MSAPFELSQALALDNSGNPLPGATLDFYVTGTTTRLDTYTNFGNSTPNANPVVADANGRFGSIYMQARLYKVVLKTAAGVEVWTKDPYTAHPFVYESALPGSAFPGLIVRNTSDLIQYQRNAANSAWVNLGPYDSVGNAASITEIRTGTATDKFGTPDSIAGLWEQGADITAAATLAIPSTGGGVFRVTGASTTISAINSATNGMEAEFYLVNAQTFTDGAGLETITGSAMTFPADSTVQFRRIGANWIMTGSNVGVNPFPRGHLWGLTLSNNAVDATNDIDIAAGECRNSANTENMVLAAALTKRLDANWAVGNNQGGLDTGSAANTTYFVYIIERPDTGVVDAIFSTSASSPTLPTGYTHFRRIGAFIRAAGAIVAFTQTGDLFLRSAVAVDVDATAPGTAAVTRTLSVPVGIQVEALLTVGGFGGTNQVAVYVSSLSVSDQAVQAAGTGALTGAANGSGYQIGGPGYWGFAEARVLTNTSGQVRSRMSVSGAADRIGIITRGWIDTRGRVA